MIHANLSQPTLLLLAALLGASLQANADTWTTPEGTFELPTGWSVNSSDTAKFTHPATGLILWLAQDIDCSHSKRPPIERPSFVDNSWVFVGQDANSENWGVEFCRPNDFGGAKILVLSAKSKDNINNASSEEQLALGASLNKFAELLNQTEELKYQKQIEADVAKASTNYMFLRPEKTPNGWLALSDKEFIQPKAGLMAYATRAGIGVSEACAIDDARAAVKAERARAASVSAVDRRYPYVWVLEKGSAFVLAACREYQQSDRSTGEEFPQEMTVFVNSIKRPLDPYFSTLTATEAAAINELTKGLADAGDYKFPVVKDKPPKEPIDWSDHWDKQRSLRISIARSFSTIADRPVDGGSLDIDVQKIIEYGPPSGLEFHLRVGGFGDETAPDNGDNRLEAAVGYVANSDLKKPIVGFFSGGAAMDSVHSLGFGAAFYAKGMVTTCPLPWLRLSAELQGFARIKAKQGRAAAWLNIGRLALGGEANIIDNIKTAQFSVGLTFGEIYNDSK